MMRKINRNNQGFTLIEVLVVITIIMLMTGLIMTNYISFAERNRVRTAAEEAQNFLSDIQNRARMGHRGEPPAGGSGCSIEFAESALNRPLQGWTVELYGNTMTAWAVCLTPLGWGAGVTAAFSEQVVRHLPQNTSFIHGVDQPIMIEFPALYENPRMNIDQDIVLTDTNRSGVRLDNYFYSFRVSAGGAISAGSFCNMNADGDCIPI